MRIRGRTGRGAPCKEANRPQPKFGQIPIKPRGNFNGLQRPFRGNLHCRKLASTSRSGK